MCHGRAKEKARRVQEDESSVKGGGLSQPRGGFHLWDDKLNAPSLKTCTLGDLFCISMSSADLKFDNIFTGEIKRPSGQLDSNNASVSHCLSGFSCVYFKER